MSSPACSWLNEKDLANVTAVEYQMAISLYETARAFRLTKPIPVVHRIDWLNCQTSLTEVYDQKVTQVAQSKWLIKCNRVIVDVHSACSTDAHFHILNSCCISISSSMRKNFEIHILLQLHSSYTCGDTNRAISDLESKTPVPLPSSAIRRRSLTLRRNIGRCFHVQKSNADRQAFFEASFRYESKQEQHRTNQHNRSCLMRCMPPFVHCHAFH